MLLRPVLFIELFVLLAVNFTHAQVHGLLPKGTHSVGFRIINTTDNDQKPLRICIWYPAVAGGGAMQLSDYVDIPSLGGPEDKNAMRKDLKSLVERIFLPGQSSVSQADFDRALSSNVWGSENATMLAGKWPLIISDTEPVSLMVTNEWLASQGFVVAIPAVMYGPPKGESDYYTGPTAGLWSVLNYMKQQTYVDNNKISALGFGGGSMASFYVSMKTDLIKSMVNIEGGLFMPESKTTLSPDYAPEKFTTPLLHIVTPRIIAGESVDQFNAVKGKKYRLTELFSLRHHDFTIYGRVANGLLRLRGEQAAAADEAFREMHEHILYFLQHREPQGSKLGQSSRFKLEVF